MPRLPTAQDLGTRVAQNRGQVVDPTAAVAPEMNARAEFASTAQQFTQDLKARRDEMSLHKARISYEKDLIEAENIYDDPDIELDTALTKHQDALEKAKSRALGMIGNNRMQSALAEDLSLAQLKALESGKDRLRALEADRGLADMYDVLSTARDVALVRDFDTAMDVANGAITTARASLYIDPVEEQGLREKYSREVAASAISMKPLKEQKEILSSNHTLSNVLAPDTRKKLLEDVNGRLVIEEGMIAADNIKAEGGDRGARLKKARQIKDPDIRQAATRQVEHDLQQEKLAIAETQLEAYQSLSKEVLNGGKSAAQVIAENGEAYDAMSFEQQAKLRELDSKNDTTDTAVYDRLNQLASRNRDEAYRYFAENGYKLSESDQKKWSDRLASKEDLDGFLTRSQRLSAKLERAEINNDKLIVEAKEAVDQDYRQFQQDNGRKPNANELDSIIDTVTQKTVDTVWFNPFSRDKYGFDQTADERDSKRTQRKLNVFEQKFEEYVSGLQDRSEVPIVVTEEEKAQFYTAWDREGLLNE